MKHTFPSKIILFGEHTILYNSSSIAIAINKIGTSNIVNKDNHGFYITDVDGNKFILKFPDVSECIEIKLDMRLGCGLGSSAVISLLIAEYILDKCNLNEINDINDINDVNDVNEINDVNDVNDVNDGNQFCSDNFSNTRYFDTKLSDIVNNVIMELKTNSNLSGMIKNKNNDINILLNTAHHIEHFFHGKSSGIDITTIFNGKMIEFCNRTFTEINTEYLSKYKIIIWDSKISKDTSKIIKSVKITKEMVNKVNNIVREACNVLSRNFELIELYKLIKMNQDILEELNVVPEVMKDEVLRMRKLNVECKVSGAGNGGHLITVVEKNMFYEGWMEVSIFKHE